MLPLLGFPSPWFVSFNNPTWNKRNPPPETIKMINGQPYTNDPITVRIVTDLVKADESGEVSRLEEDMI